MQRYDEAQEQRFYEGWQITPLFNATQPLPRILESSYTTYLQPYLHSKVVSILIEYSQGDVSSNFVIWNQGFPQVKQTVVFLNLLTGWSQYLPETQLQPIVQDLSKSKWDQSFCSFIIQCCYSFFIQRTMESDSLCLMLLTFNTLIQAYPLIRSSEINSSPNKTNRGKNTQSLHFHSPPQRVPFGSLPIFKQTKFQWIQFVGQVEFQQYLFYLMISLVPLLNYTILIICP